MTGRGIATGDAGMGMALQDQLRPYIAGQASLGDWSRGQQAQPKGPAPGAAVLVASLVLNFFGLAMPLVILQVYDRILPNHATGTLLLLIVGLVVVLALDGLFRSIRSYITGWNGAGFEHQANCRAVDRLLATEINAFERSTPGVHIDRLMAVATLRDFHAGQAKLLVVDLPFIALFLGLIAAIAGWLVLVPLAVFLLLGAASALVGLFLRRALSDRARLDDRRYSFVIEILSGLQTIKLLDMEAQMERRYERLQESTAAASYDVTLLSNLAQNLGWVFSNLTMIGVAAAGASLVIAGQISMGGLAACILLSGRSVQPILRALGLWTQYQGIAIARQRLDEIFELEPEPVVADARVGPLAGAIELDQVSFAYGPEEPDLLKEVSLSAAAGEVIGISGESGAGKTTLLMTMMGALRPTAGRVEIDGQDIASLDSQDLRSQIAFMPQNAVLFQGTIIQNLTLFRGATAVDAAIEAARLLGVDEAIRHLPEGYQTRVGDGAELDLPVGLKQGIGMARALAHDPRIILFDEANGGLDSAADQRLRATLETKRGSATIVIISHRPSLLNLADRRFELIDGHLRALTSAAARATAVAPEAPDTPEAPEAPEAPAGDGGANPVAAGETRA